MLTTAWPCSLARSGVHERDQLVSKDPVYKALLDSKSPAPQTVYLVSTSAGEVGIDLDADHMVCGLTTLDSMIQRLGRVNRRGSDGRAARIDVVWAEKKAKPGNKALDIDKAIATTLAILQRWRGESGGEIPVSPRNLRTLVEELGDDERTEAFSPKPTIPPLTNILLDAWSLTSIDKMPGRPEVAAYLHGLTHDPPETYVVWRKEIKALEQAAPSAFSNPRMSLKSVRAEKGRLQGEDLLSERIEGFERGGGQGGGGSCAHSCRDHEDFLELPLSPPLNVESGAVRPR